MALQVFFLDLMAYLMQTNMLSKIQFTNNLTSGVTAHPPKYFRFLAKYTGKIGAEKLPQVWQINLKMLAY